MDRHPSTIKRHRQSLVNAQRNRSAKSKMRTLIKNTQNATDVDAAETAFKELSQIVDKNTRRHVIHKNTGARIKSRLRKHVDSLTTKGK